MKNETGESEILLQKKLNIFFLMGQSNMQGIKIPHVKNNFHHSQLFVLETNEVVQHENYTTRWAPAHESTYLNNSISMIPAFVKEINRLLPESLIGIIPIAIGGSTIEDWISNYYYGVMDIAKKAIVSGEIKGVLWHQGENDSAYKNSAENYYENLYKMIYNLRNDLNDPSLPIIAGQLGTFLNDNKQYPYFELINNAIKKASENIQAFGIVSSEGLADYQGDKIHFDPDSLDILGKRYADEYLKIIRKYKIGIY